MNKIKSEPWFSAVEVEINSHCNRRCSYCPVSLSSFTAKKDNMPAEVFDRLVEQLVTIDYRGRISYNIYNEPLLNKDLEVYVRKVSASLPKARQLIFTNGDLLDDRRHASLLDAGISHFLVTRHDDTPIVRRPNQSVRYSGEIQLNNRGGVLSNLSEPLSQPCYAPSEMLIVSIAGNVQLCCNDGEKQYVMGNVLENSLGEIWFSPKFRRVRELLENGQREAAAGICGQCNDFQFLTPGQAEVPDWMQES